MKRSATETLDQQCERIATNVAAGYARRLWWVDEEDFRQQAWLVVMEVRARMGAVVDREKFGAHAHVAASRQLSRYAARQGSPVSASDKGVREMRTLQPLSCSVYTLLSEHGRGRDVHVDAGPIVADAVARADVHDTATRLLAQLRRIAQEAAIAEDVADAALSVLALGDKPHAAAAQHGVHKTYVYRALYQLRVRSRTDVAVQALKEA